MKADEFMVWRYWIMFNAFLCDISRGCVYYDMKNESIYHYMTAHKYITSFEGKVKQRRRETGSEGEPK